MKEDSPGMRLLDSTLYHLVELSAFPDFLFFSENASTVRQNSSSDEEETIADVGNDSMDIDNLDRKCNLLLV